MKKWGKDRILRIFAVLAGILALTGGGLGVLALFLGMMEPVRG